MRRACALLAALFTLSVAAGPAAAAPSAPRHPLGGFSVNRYDGLVVAPGELRVDHVQDLAEIAAAQYGPRPGTDPGTWAAARCAAAARAMGGTASGRPLSFTVRASSVRTLPGQAGLPTLRVECALAAPAGEGAITFRDDGGRGTAGWSEITARGDRMTLTSADVPAVSRSRRLTAYPDGLPAGPPAVRSASLRVRAGGPAADASPVSGIVPRGVDGPVRALTGLVAQRRLTVGFAVAAVAIALALGVLHALAPGHGKTLMLAYAADRGVRPRRDVLTLGATVTLTHTAGVIALGLLILSGAALEPGPLLGALGVAGGSLVAAAGTFMLRRALHARKAHGHGHGHGHGHVHSRGGRRAVLLGFAGGLVPSPSAVLVLVGAAAIGRAWFGVVLVLAYGLGLALTLVAVGLLVLGAGRALARRLPDVRLRAPRTLPVVTSAAVVLLGAGLALRSLPLTGI